MSSDEGARGLEVHACDGRIVEEDIPCRLLEERVPTRPVSTKHLGERSLTELCACAVPASRPIIPMG